MTELADLFAPLTFGVPIRVGAIDFLALVHERGSRAPAGEDQGRRVAADARQVRMGDQAAAEVPSDPLGEVSLLEDALAEGHTTVTEVGEQGIVNEVVVSHTGRRVLLLLDGEQIAGAKQNRIFNASFVVPPGTTARLPVSCVERGRWAHRSAGFQASGTTLEVTARSAKLHRMARTTVTTGRHYDAGQGEVWRDVDTYLASTRTASATSAYADAYATRAQQVERDLGQLAPLPGQVGVSVVHGRRLLSLDLFGSPELYARAAPKLLRGALAAILERPGATGSAEDTVTSALASLSRAPLERRPTPAGGESWLVSTGEYSFCAAVYQGRVFHAVAAGVA